MYHKLATRISHKLWRKLLKKERRRQVRVHTAKLRDEIIYEGQQKMLSDPLYVAQCEEEEKMEKAFEEIEKERQNRLKEEFITKDLASHEIWLKKKQEKLNFIKKICCEMKEQLENNSHKTKSIKDKPENSQVNEEEMTHNPEPPIGYPEMVEEPREENPCPFFKKTGACRFGHFCSRDHTYPEESRIILLPNMYTHFGLEGDLIDDYDTDISLEFSESESEQHFREFFEDVIKEFKRCGDIIQFKVCNNRCIHLRGNVYIEYSTKSAAKRAVGIFNGRWYAGKQLSCFLVSLDSFSSAVCGLYWKKKCARGGDCNFLHVYQNPRGIYQDSHRKDRRRNMSPTERRSSKSLCQKSINSNKRF